MKGALIGLVVACVLSLAATFALGLGPDASFLVGLMLGVCCTLTGLALDDA